MNDKLCPCCGGKGLTPKVPLPDGETRYITCSDCSVDATDDDWNRRVPPPMPKMEWGEVHSCPGVYRLSLNGVTIASMAEDHNGYVVRFGAKKIAEQIHYDEARSIVETKARAWWGGLWKD